MKLILVNQRYGHTRTIVIRGWMKGLLSLCLLGAPVALGYLGYELALADNSGNVMVSQEARPATDALPGNNSRHLLPSYQSALAGQAAGATRSTDNSFYAVVAAAGIGSLLLQPAGSLFRKKPVRVRPAFAHGRLVDPAMYFSHTHH